MTHHVEAPGIGAINEIDINNHDTRAVFVTNTPVTHAEQLWQLFTALPEKTAHLPGINRHILKAIARHPFQEVPGMNDFMAEACLPFTHQGEEFYWLVYGRNTVDRTPDHYLAQKQRETLTRFAHNGSQPQSAEAMMDFVVNKNHGKGGTVQLARITPDNFATLAPSLADLYGSAFSEYPYDVVSVIGTSCDHNVFVAAIRTYQGRDEVIAVTGAERTTVAGMPVAEIGDSASRSEFSGFGALTKAFLLQTLYDLEVEGQLMPAIAITDSRISNDLAVIKANHRAGITLPKDIPILHWHTLIGSAAKDPGYMREIRTSNGLKTCENMTMTCITADILRGRYRQNPQFWRLAEPGQVIQIVL